jgi:glutaryl-CoA dehydrogenase
MQFHTAQFQQKFFRQKSSMNSYLRHSGIQRSRFSKVSGVRFASSIGDPFAWETQSHWKDMFMIDRLLTEDEKMIRDLARSFARSELLPSVAKAFRHEEFDRSVYLKMGDVGILGPTIDGYGCSGSTYVSYGLIAQELEYVDSAYRSAYSVQSSLVMHPINIFGSEYQKAKWLPGLAKGELIGCFGLTEPDHGSDPAGMETTARKVGKDEWILNGSKLWITSSPIADVAIVWSKDAETKKVRGFIVDTKLPGVTCPKIEGKMSLRASVTGGIVLEDVRVSEKESLLPKIEGMKGPFSCLNSARLGIAFGVTGAARACIDTAVQYTMDRHQFNKPLAANQLIQKKLADALTEVSLGELAALRASQMRDSGILHSNVISMIKRNNCGKALEIARQCRDMLGGNGIVDEYSVIRHALNLEAVNTYEGTHDIHALILGRAMTGLSAF